MSNSVTFTKWQVVFFNCDSKRARALTGGRIHALRGKTHAPANAVALAAYASEATAPTSAKSISLGDLTDVVNNITTTTTIITIESMELTPGSRLSPPSALNGLTGAGGSNVSTPAMPTTAPSGLALGDKEMWFRLMEQNPLVLRHLLNVATQSLRGDVSRFVAFGETSKQFDFRDFMLWIYLFRKKAVRKSF